METAETADAEVWHAIGDAFANGRGTERNRDVAKKWFERAAAAGHTRSMIRLGLILQHPDTPETHGDAVAWFRKAADLGDPGGMVWLGFAHREGRGAPRDLAEAAQWFIKAAKAGDHHAMIHAGRLYAGELADPAEAVKWFGRAAEAGQTESYIALAMLHDDRRSEVYDPAEAAKWYQAVVNASRGSLGRAMLALARHARDGIGTPRDLEQAKEWLRRVVQTEPERSSFRKEAARLLQQMQEDLL
jgi:TPR repeat protein